MKKIYNAPEGCKITSTEIVDNQVIVTFEEEKHRFKDGDFVYFRYKFKKNCYYICILREYTRDTIRCSSGVCSIDDKSPFIGDILFSTEWNNNVRLATEEEKQYLLNKLTEKGYYWDAEKKNIVKKLWRAEKGGEYWYISGHNIRLVMDKRYYIDNENYSSGNYFRTEEEAQKYADKIKEILKNRTL